MATTTAPKRRRFEFLVELLLGVELDRPLICPSCNWIHRRARLATLQLLAAGRAVRCTWCAKPMTQQQAPK